MSNQVDLLSISSPEDLGDYSSCVDQCGVLTANNSIPTLWMFLFRESDLKVARLGEDDEDGHSVLITRKTTALKQLNESVAALASIAKTDLTEHARYFAKYLRSFPGKYLAVPGVTEWVTTKKIIRGMLSYLASPTKKGFADHIRFFRFSEHLQPPPTRRDLHQELDADRAACYWWLFGETNPMHADKPCPWMPKPARTQSNKLASMLAETKKWVTDNKGFLYEDSCKDLSEYLKSDRSERNFLLFGSCLDQMGLWSLQYGQVAVSDGDESAGWEAIGQGFQMARTSFLCDVWSKSREPSRHFFCPLPDLTRLMLISSFLGDTRFATFCSKVLVLLYEQSSFTEDLSPNFIAVIGSQKLGKIRIPKSIVEELPLLDVHQRVIDAWGGRNFKTAMTEFLEFHERSQAYETLAGVPLEACWIFEERKKKGLRNPQLDHWLWKDNPLMRLPDRNLSKCKNPDVDNVIAYLRKMTPKKAEVFDLKLPASFRVES